MPKPSNKRCSFCNRHEEEVGMLLTGMTGLICSDCVERAHEIITETTKQKSKTNTLDKEELPRPKDMKAFLDQYVIGQDDAKRYLAVSVYNHYKRLMQHKTDDDVEIEKSNIIMVGST